MKFIKAAFAHKIFVSIALSDTGVMRGVRLHSMSLVFAVMTLIALFAASMFVNITNQQTGEQESLGTYLRDLAGLSTEQSVQEEQVKILAQEMGVLKARLDRFDIIGQRLFNDDIVSAAVDEDLLDDGQGGPDIDMNALSQVSVEDLQRQIQIMTDQLSRVDGYMDTGLALLAESESDKLGRPHLWPVISHRTRVTSAYGYRSDPFTGKKAWHSGVDIGGGWNVPIISSGDGIVVFSGYRFRYGLMVEVRHANGYTTRYGHLAKISVENGQQVAAGDLVGEMGSTGRSTGPHLHFEVLIDDQKVNPYPFIRDGFQLARKQGRELQLAQNQ